MKNLNFILLIIVAVITLTSCEKEFYNDNPRHSNLYFIFEKTDMDSIYILNPEKGKTLYNDRGNLNWKDFEKVENNFVEFQDDVIYFYGDADFLYYDGDLSDEQNWIHDHQIHYLNIEFPVAPPNDGFYTLSTSIRNW